MIYYINNAKPSQKTNATFGKMKCPQAWAFHFSKSHASFFPALYSTSTHQITVRDHGEKSKTKGFH
jgi:hypothetical protein